ncbi:BgTH12-04746 [Blumeria graminis f. sp. triticale]|uniref:BgtAcSP-31292 n=3 Tax=Blumeria graminis TaxID=34373 RepID=A0A9X9L7L9_BLUGR|nr:hypothetical protein BGT96224_AcSP31292 [Blumeria graminis f. sp. tritici 96224]CAD6499094.1 BgTH12-04746 [Blumeria graminis f. sp. triticale]VCU39230.1 BgtAcSP-31292 [Blumeria graminis f. sp. tritici]
MKAWKLFYILAIFHYYSVEMRGPDRSREFFKCNNDLIPSTEAKKSAALGCDQLKIAHPTSIFPASYIDPGVFGKENTAYFTWPVYVRDNTLSRDFSSQNRVLIDSDCQLIGLVKFTSQGQEACMHLISRHKTELDHSKHSDQSLWTNLPHAGFKYKKELYLTSDIEDFIQSDTQFLLKCYSSIETILDFAAPTSLGTIKVWKCPIALENGVIKSGKIHSIRYLLLGQDRKIIGVARRDMNRMRVLTEVRILNEADKAKLEAKKSTEGVEEEVPDVKYDGFLFTSSLLKSHRRVACFTLRNDGKSILPLSAYLSNNSDESSAGQATWTWPLRMPETFRNDRNYLLLINNLCEIIGIRKGILKLNTPRMKGGLRE